MQRANRSCHVKSGGNFSQIFKRLFLETTFSNTFDMISQDIYYLKKNFKLYKKQGKNKLFFQTVAIL